MVRGHQVERRPLGEDEDGGDGVPELGLEVGHRRVDDLGDLVREAVNGQADAMVGDPNTSR